jgi:pheromone a factor receptor
MFSGIAVYNFLSKRRRFQAVLQQSSSSLNISRFIRLVALSLVEMFIAVPLTSWVLYDNAVQPLKTLGWTELHFDWSRIVYYVNDPTHIDLRLADAAHWQVVSSSQFEHSQVTRWIPVFTAFLYFTFFGTQEEALSGYSAAVNFLSFPFRRLKARDTGNR